MAYCTSSDANNLKTRVKAKLKLVDLQRKAPFYGFRWLAPGKDDLLIQGELKRKAGRKASPLFTLVGELLPRDGWIELPERLSGVYILFDAAETARYVGMAKNIKARLRTYFTGNKTDDEDKRQVVSAFSVYAVSTRQRARELESLLIHAMGPQLFLDRRKHRFFAQQPDCKLFEPGTLLLKRRTKYVGVTTMRDSLP
jgi:hypothetical protein